MKTKQPKNPRRAKGLGAGKNSVAGIQPPLPGEYSGLNAMIDAAMATASRINAILDRCEARTGGAR